MRMALQQIHFPRQMSMFPAWARTSYLGPESGPKGAWRGEVDTDTREIIIKIRESAGDPKSPLKTWRMGLEGCVYNVAPTGKLTDSD